MIEPMRDDLLKIIGRFSRARIVLIGDFVADEFVDGEISRVSREAPVLILKHRQTRIVPGGAANAANNLVDLGAKVYPYSVVGQDLHGLRLVEYFHRKRVPTDGIVVDRGFSTTVKSRILAGSAHTMHQQVVRIDHEPPRPPREEISRRLYAKAATRARSVDGILVSDYGSGVVKPSHVAVLRSVAGGRRIPSVVDCRYQLPAYRSFTAATPNEAEVEAALQLRIGNNLRALETAGRRLLRQIRTKALLITRGKEGMALFEPGQKTRHIPIYGTDQIADVTGAGDTVIAVFTLALACRATFFEAALLSNYAGGIVVMKHGTATVLPEELVAAVKSGKGNPA